MIQPTNPSSGGLAAFMATGNPADVLGTPANPAGISGMAGDTTSTLPGTSSGSANANPLTTVLSALGSVIGAIQGMFGGGSSQAAASSVDWSGLTGTQTVAAGDSPMYSTALGSDSTSFSNIIASGIDDATAAG